MSGKYGGAIQVSADLLDTDEGVGLVRQMAERTASDVGATERFTFETHKCFSPFDLWCPLACPGDEEHDHELCEAVRWPHGHAFWTGRKS